MDAFRFIPRLLQLEDREVPAASNPFEVTGAVIAVKFDHKTLMYAYHHPNAINGTQGLTVANKIADISPGLAQTLLDVANQLQQTEASASPVYREYFDRKIEFFSSLAVTALNDAAGARFIANYINQAVAKAATQNATGTGSVGSTGTGFPVTGTNTGTAGSGTNGTNNGTGITGTGANSGSGTGTPPGSGTSNTDSSGATNGTSTNGSSSDTASGTSPSSTQSASSDRLSDTPGEEDPVLPA